MLESKECFDNIQAFILGERVGKLAFSTDRKRLGLSKSAAIFEKFKNYASQKEKQRSLLSFGKNKVRKSIFSIGFLSIVFSPTRRMIY